MSWHILTLTTIIIFTASTYGQIDEFCNHPLGMEDKRINDVYITATSSFARSLEPKYARLNRDEGDGAWCPLSNIEPGSEEYLQIELTSLYFVTGIATQGRYSHGTGQEFVKTYKIMFSRDGVDWWTWYSNQRVFLLNGNSDTNTINRRSLVPGIAGTKYIRVIPVTSRSTPVCLRVELYGCRWQSGLISYNIPTPDDFMVPNPDFMFSDDTYDGAKWETVFERGLGQLTDGVIGSNDLKKTNSRYQKTAVGYDYVAWTTRDERDKDVEMRFIFDSLRNFSSLTVYCYVDPNVDASLFSVVHIYPSMNGVLFSSSPIVSFNNRKGDRDTHARVFNLPLSSVNLLAVALKVVFEVPKGKLVLSEIEFYNELIPPELANRYINDPPWEIENLPGVETNKPGSQLSTKAPDDKKATENNTGVVVGILVGVIVLLVLVVAALCYRQRKLRKTATPPSYLFQPTNHDDPLVILAPRVSSGGDEAKVPIYHEISSVTPGENIYHEPKDALGRTPPPPYQANEATSGAAASNQPNNAPTHYAEANLFARQLFAQSLQGVSGNNIYSVPWSTPSPKSRKRKNKKSNNFPNLHGSNNNKSLAEERKHLLSKIHSDEMPPEFPRGKLQFIEKLGEGQFGEVHLCRADPLIRELEDDHEFSLPGSRDSPVLVAVKILRENASHDAKEDFFKEVRIMSRLLHPNIVRLLAVCTDDQPFAMVTEYMEHGDLNQYLQSFDDELQPTPGKKVIRTETLVKITAQIASGLDYLSSLNFVHRDLATRNCLVGTDNEIRIADFGMSRNMYQSDYYRIQGKAVLPIRWMAWECILLGKFSNASDVWAFGVTLWEIYSLCKYQPFASMTDEQVINNLHQVHQNTKNEVHLPRPKRCPTTLYNMMKQCWKREPNERPTSSQLLSYLLERQHTNRYIPKPKRPQGKPPLPKV